MSRYIDADALKPDYYDEYVLGDDEYVVRYYSETQIDNAPSIDIVRCGECRHRITGIMGKMCIGRHPDDFCSYGERKE